MGENRGWLSSCGGKMKKRKKSEFNSIKNQNLKKIKK